MSITRAAPYGVLTDDSGDNISGTKWDNAWVQGFLDLLDARWSLATSSLTGTQTVINPSEADVLLLQNATDLTIRSITYPSSPVKVGKRLVIFAAGAGNVFLNYNDTTGTTAANRLFNKMTSAATPLASAYGSAVFVAETGGGWAMEFHDQGAPIAWTPTDASGASLSLSNGGSRYFVQGKKVWVSLDVTYPVTANGSAAKIALPYTPASFNSALAVGYCSQGAGVNALVRTAANCELIFATGTSVTNANMGTATGKQIIASGTFITS